MRLRNLTMKGFKSFADETTLNFTEDVIGVVGPNGSGKSNVVDAIRWVLGEQKSSELRLDKMTDVIFNGTKTRKHAHTAQVTLTFENDKGILPLEYNTVEISRVLYRNGDSEYLLNNVKCRLKDINTLLMDTGMGSNSYAIIALGMVDDILADKNNARRQMFEQAAGISKFKKRKKETHRKLAATSADLDRIEDLIYEIEANLKSLEKQARRAQKYLDIKTQYKNKSIVLTKLSVGSLGVELTAKQKELQEETDKYRELDVLRNRQESQLEKTKKDNVQYEINLTTQQKQMNDLVSLLREKESEKELLKQKKQFKHQNINSAQQSIESKQEELKSLNTALAQLSEKITGFDRDLAIKNEALADLKRNYESIKETYRTSKASADAKAQLRSQYKQETFDLEKEAALLENNIVNIEEQLKRSADTMERKSAAMSEVTEALTNLKQAIQLKSEELSQLQEAKDNLVEKIQQTEEKINHLTEQLTQINRSLDAKSNEYNLLKSMVDNLEGYPESVKYLDRHWDAKVPLLSDLLEVEDDYKVVIEQYLEPYLGYFVVEDVRTALEAIDMLTTAQKGKANFFILDQVKPIEDNFKISGNLIPAIGKVKVEEAYRHLLGHLLKHVYLVDDYRPGVEDVIDNETVLLSKNGKVKRTKVSITGGSIGLFEGKKIGRKKTLEKLKQQIKSLESEKADAENNLNAVKRQLITLRESDVNKRLKLVENELNELGRDQVKLSAEAASLQNLQKEFIEEQDKGKERISTLRSQLGDIEEQKRQVQVKLDAATLQSEDEGDLENLSDSLSKASEKYNEANIEFIRSQNLLENFKSDRQYKADRVKSIERDLRQADQRKENLNHEIKEIENSITSIDAFLAENYTEKKNLETGLSDAEKDYYAGKNQILELEDELRKTQRSQNLLQTQVQKIKDQITDLRFKMNSISERLNIEFGISLDAVLETDLEEDYELDDLSLEVQKLRDRLSRFGEINPMAVDTYNDMKERYDHIIQQRADILEAKESLLATIKEIEDKATGMFMEKFHQVKENFVTVFRSLFSEEDDCDLVLVDHENPLESEIEIIAKPKGKKPKSLSQLSGGEKTLTATALLFSLYLLKPAPFCIFDEVDAPLDDANIEKFNRIIKKFSDESQFIIVTHNKATMTAVDVLYGVHMQEQGVSAVTPVDFREMRGVEYVEAVG